MLKLEKRYQSWRRRINMLFKFVATKKSRGTLVVVVVVVVTTAIAAAATTR